MSKTQIDFKANGRTQDCVISHNMEVKKEKGEVVWLNKADGTVKTVGCVSDIKLYIRDVKDGTKCDVVNLSVSSIKDLYAKIMEIEEMQGESNEF